MDMYGIIKGTRSDPPENWQHLRMAPLPDITLTWHHTIPRKTLARMWNGMVVGRHWDAIYEYLQLISAPEPQKVLKQLKGGNVQLRRELRTRVEWPSWNIVEGPGTDNRVDDPKDNFETWCSHNLSSKHRTTLYAITSIYDVIKKIPGPKAGDDDCPELDKKLARELTKVFEQNKHALRGKEPINWIQEMWTVVQDGKVHPHRPRQWSRIPKWQKRSVAA